MATPIADMVEQMLSTGLSADMIVLAVRTAELHAANCLPSIDEAAERRRAYDRERKARLPADWAQLTAAVFERDGHACVYCGDRSTPLHCDHVIPLSRGGSSSMDNLATACSDCNLAKGAQTPDEWRARCQ